MKGKLIQKIVGVALGLTMAIGVGVAVSNTSKNAVHAAGTSVTYAQTSTTAASVSTGSAPAGSSITFSTTYSNNKNQMTSGNSQTWTFKGYSGYEISNITASLRNNKSKGAGSAALTNNGSSVTLTKSSFSGLGDSYSSQTLLSGSFTCSGDIVLTLSCSVNSFYSESVSFQWQQPGSTPVTGISLSSVNYTPDANNVVELNLGGDDSEDTITATITPDNATDKSITWTSSNEDIAMVDDGDVILDTSVEGEAIVTAVANGGTNVSASITYKVVDNRTLTNVTKDADPTTKTYTDGDTLDVTGMEVYAYYDSTKDTTNLASEVVWANGGVLSEGQTEITGYIPKDTKKSFPITVSGLTVNAPSYTNTYNIKGNYLIKHNKSGNGTYYYLKSNGDSALPSAVTSVDDATVFTFKLVGHDTFEIKSGSNYLYTSDANNGLRIGTTQQSWKVNAPTSGKAGSYALQNTTYTSRFLSVYGTQDFRTYGEEASGRTENTDLEAVKSVSSFDIIAGEGAQTRFLKGNPFNYSTAGYTAQITYDDNSTEDVSANTTWTLDTSTVGTNKTLTASFTKKDVEYTDTVTGLEVYVVSAAKLSIDASSATTTFVKDATLNTSGLVINGLNSNDEVVIENIDPSRCSFNPTTLSTVGTQTITVSYTNEDETVATGTYSVTVENNSVLSFSWTKRPGFNSEQSNYSNIWAGETTLGDLIAANADGAGVFAPTWKYAKEDSPTYGTGDHQVHIGLYDSPAPASEGVALDSTHVFTSAENGKYVVAFYEGKASSTNKKLSVVKWRSVIGDAELAEVYDFSNGGDCTQTGDITDAQTVTKGNSTTKEDDSIRLGSGSKGGSLTFATETTNLTKVVVTAKYYKSSEATMTVNGTDYNLGENFADIEISLSNDVKEVVVEATGANKRFYVSKVIIYTEAKNAQIGKTADCLGLETFIDTYLHMDDYEGTEGQAGPGWCKDEKHNYYGKNTNTGAKSAFNSLNANQRRIFTTNSAYLTEWTRLKAWAAANGEALGTDGVNENVLKAESYLMPFKLLDENSSISVIVIISLVSITAIGGYFFIRKRKEQ